MVKIKERPTHKRHPSTIHSSFLNASTENYIGGTGVASLSESLKSNTTLTVLYICGTVKKKDTQKTSINKSLFSILSSSTENRIEVTGAASLSEALKSNTTITDLDLASEDKRKKTHKRHPSTIHCFAIASTDNMIGERGVTSLSESLKSNTTLTKLYLWGEYKEGRHTNDIHQQFTLFVSLLINRQQDWRQRSNITE